MTADDESEIEEHVAAVVPDWAGVPIYVVSADELGITLGDHCGFGGFCVGAGAAAIRERLPDRFKGRGPTAIYRKSMVRDWHDVLAVACHEFCHEIVSGLWKDKPVAEETAPIIERVMNRHDSPDEIGMHEAVALDAIRGHDARFFRVALHLADRLNRARCLGVSGRCVVQYRGVLDHSTIAMREALKAAGEFEQFRGLPFADLLKTEPPAAFVELWESGNKSSLERARKQDAAALEAINFASESRKETNMNFTSILAKLRDTFSRKQKEAALTFNGLVLEIAGGKEPAEAAVEKVLAASGRTFADLENEVSRIVTRRHLRTQIAELEKRKLELAENDKKLIQADQEFEAYRLAHVAKYAPLVEKKKTEVEVLQNLERLKRQLQNGPHGPEPEVVSRLKELTAERAELEKRRDWLRIAARDARSFAATERHYIKDYSPPEEVDRYEARARDHEVNAERWEAEEKEAVVRSQGLAGLIDEADEAILAS